ncbi:MAG: hypothetical protein J6W27_01160 [Alphaproteobacteria bacterium]|nr:hypothetical protein [Alphaproteobacteria bacterium]
MKKLVVLLSILVLTACSSGPKYRTLYVDVNKTEKEPTTAVYTSLMPVDGPDGICIYVKGKCDTSELDFLKEDLYKAYNSKYLANYHANLIYQENHISDGLSYTVIDSDIKKHENPYKTKSNNIVIIPNYHVLDGSHYYTAKLYYKNKEIGEVRTGGYGNRINADGQEWLKNIMPTLSWCAAVTGFHGKLGGEEVEDEDKLSPSMIEFFKQCGIDYYR